MCKTRHFTQRLSQRGIKTEVIDILLQFGKIDGDKLVLNRDSCLFLANLFGNMKNTLNKMAEAGGHTLVLGDDDALVTIYRTGSFNKTLAIKSSVSSKNQQYGNNKTNEEIYEVA